MNTLKDVSKKNSVSLQLSISVQKVYHIYHKVSYSDCHIMKEDALLMGELYVLNFLEKHGSCDNEY